MSVNTYINGQLVRVSGSSTQTQYDAIQVAALPTASAQYVGKVYQYIGNDTETAKHGLFYGCIEENAEYKWVQVNTDPDTESISNEKLAAMWGTDLSVVDVQTLHATGNGTYNAPNGVAYNPVVVDTEAWEPLEDGYSNFWFELTNDTLSPWLIFNAKNNDAVIDWGDGSGEVTLDTLTPTHTYSKAGMYIVKVKGARSIGQQLNTTDAPEYFHALKAVEMNTEITGISTYAFRYCLGLKNMVIDGSISYIQAIAYMCSSLENVVIKSTSITELRTVNFYNCHKLSKITIPSTVNSIGNQNFQTCLTLSEAHILATTPPTLGTSVFNGIYIDQFTIYVPVGYGNTYKTTSGWSDYADHIVEES